ncbi:MAG: DUF1311 domain-containing protein [Spirosomaceae bacterium]|jgi:uncharacterized protein YecT (DUF1311 family)|nr:DUF1311 domain-containing protein [Spirosomataceae bacterium]
MPLNLRFTAKTLLLITFCFAVTSALYAQQEVHPIDAALDKCMDKNPSTQGMIGCIDEAFKKWDAELNKNYKALTLQLNPAQKAALLASQRKWLEYRDLEFKNIGAFYETMDGTMYRPMAASDRMEVVKKRALDLKGFLDILEMK